LPTNVNADRVVTAALIFYAQGFDCDAGFFPCNEKNWNGAWSAFRAYSTEVVLLQRFLSAPPGIIVDNFADANIVIVPALSQFLQSWDFFWNGGARFCPRGLLAHLKLDTNYTGAEHKGFQATQQNPHYIFLYTDHLKNLFATDTHGIGALLDLPHIIHISYGSEIASARTITVPAVVTNRELQPSTERRFPGAREHFLLFAESVTGVLYASIRKALYDYLLSDRGRQACSTGGSCVVHRRARRVVHSQSADAALHESHGVQNLSNAEFDALMLSSTFCPVLPGDNPYRIKFYHAILAGCLPVVLDFPSYVPGLSSWWKPRGAPHIFNVPFPDRVDYSSFVVTVPWKDTPDFPEMFLQRLLSMSAVNILDRQVAMERNRNFVLYDWSGSGPDAFTALLDRTVDILDDDAHY
jgi:hypothetical protein